MINFIVNVIVLAFCCVAVYGLYRFEVEKTNERKERRERERQLEMNFDKEEHF